jgi:aconitate hydratase
MNSFGSRQRLDPSDSSHEIFRLGVLDVDLGAIPYSIKILLENLLRHEDGVSVTADDIWALASGIHDDGRREISFMPARILLQDFTGVPTLVDMAAMRDAVRDLGSDPSRVNPFIPVDLVIDHSVSVDSFGGPDSFRINAELEFQRNAERYEFLRWGQDAFGNLRVVPPDTGICHQVNLEHLAQVVFVDEHARLAYPDSLLGTDSHTPMINGLGVLGWGVGGIEAEAAMLGQPISMLVPDVVGFRLEGELREGATATDLVLTITEMMRHHGVVGKFVEFFGPGVSAVPLASRATIGNMSPEYGSTITIFPIDDETLRYLEMTGRPPGQISLVERYAKEQGLWFDAAARPNFSTTMQLDLGTVVPSLAGPARPQDRVPLDRARTMFREALTMSLPDLSSVSYDEAVDETFPASDPPAAGAGMTDVGEPDQTNAPDSAPPTDGALPARRHRHVPVRLGDQTFELDHGHVVLAAITSCTNTSNPSVMIEAGLLARNAVALGLQRKPWVKTSLAPGSRVVMDYYAQAGLTPALEQLGFHLVGFGCTTCIGNSGPLPPPISAAIDEAGLAVVSVLSGNRNFEGRINGDVRMNYLASPALVIAYALAGTMDIDLLDDPLGTSSDGAPVYLRDIWPSRDEVDAVVHDSIDRSMFHRTYAEIFSGDERWNSIETPASGSFRWLQDSTYIQRPPYFDGVTLTPAPLVDVVGARVLAVLGDSVTTDHISPAGSIRVDSPAGRWLVEHGVVPGDFNSYGARRGNHHVMIRGTFASPRLRNRMAPGTEGGYTRHMPDGAPMSIYDAAMQYAREGTPLVILAGKDYGSGSSRDWAAKGTTLLGVKAVIAESFERIHRSNLIGMGVLPLQFPHGETVATLGLTGTERFDIVGLADAFALGVPRTLVVRADHVEFTVDVRVDTAREADFYRHGGILPYALRAIVSRSS